jgi:hypothetical protein
MKRILALALLLASCSEVPVLQPGPSVDVPVALHCQHEALSKPVFPLETLKQNASATQLLQACLQTGLLRQAYELRCEAIVRTCE